MRHLDLFSGIGGFALATEMAFPDMNIEHVFCDNDPFSQAILKKHWPNSLIYDDIKELTQNRIATDTGREYGESWGVSSMEADSTKRTSRESDAKRRSEDASNPYSERKLQSQGSQQELREWVGNGIDILTGGFPCQPFSAAGRRRGTEDDRHLWPEMLRVIRETNPTYIVGENVGGLLTWDGGLVFEQVCADLEEAGYEVAPFVIPAAAVGAPHRRDRVWIVAHRIGERSQRGSHEQHLKRISQSTEDTGYFQQDITNARWDWNQDWQEVATALCRVDDGIPKRLDRTPRLKALGNAIVPQVAAEVIKVLTL